jgi:hypothetical protein
MKEPNPSEPVETPGKINPRLQRGLDLYLRLLRKGGKDTLPATVRATGAPSSRGRR